MDEFANKPTQEKQDIFELASVQKGLSPQIIEKDFWVCWTLKQLFSMDSISDELIFKGGTSLSKAYQLIERFSEDVDITIDKKFFGFSGDKDPINAGSNKKCDALIKELSDSCRQFVQTELKEMLDSRFSSVLKNIETPWSIEIDDADVDGQSLLFYYPTISTPQINQYIRSAVKIELGARGDNQPSRSCLITPFIEELFPTSSSLQPVHITTLAAERTFWEKATIAHQLSHWPTDKKIPERQSRHFFDLYKLLCSEVKRQAEATPELLDQVAAHKKIYFRSGWAQYDTAKQGSLRLIPEQSILNLLENDYHRMQEMFYGDVVSWNTIISTIQQFEVSFNKTDDVSSSFRS